MSTRPVRLPGRIRGPKKRTTQPRSYESPVLRSLVRGGTTSGGTAAIAMLIRCLQRGQTIEDALAYYEGMGTKMQRRYLVSAAKSGALAEWMTRRGFDVHLIDWLLPISAPQAEATP